jgi:aldehyde:ferredoxin oxidoreductase
MYGYYGKMLIINLSDNSTEEKEISEEILKHFIGGHALGARLLFNEMPAKTDVFAEESALGFITGPLNDARTMFGGRYTVVSKCPATGGFNDANSGGFFAPALKRTGYDAIFFKGISKTPVYVFLDNGEVSFHDATHLWGLTTTQTEAALTKEISGKFNAALIGPAGEGLSHMSGVMNDGHRSAARGGSGAVMGSKKLKAFAVRGSEKVEIYNRDGVSEINKLVKEGIEDGAMCGGAEMMSDYGTGFMFPMCVSNDDAGIKNWRGSCVGDYSDEEAEFVSPYELDDYKEKQYGCVQCPLRCGAIYKVEHQKWPLEHTGRPEYETSSAFGSNLLNKDGVSVLKCNDLCNEYGFDTISAGGTVAWAMDCYNNGILTKEELDGIDLAWGNADAIVELMEKIAKNEGCGKMLFNGSKAAAEAYGKGFERLAVASGIEIGHHNPRLGPGLARTFQYDPTPGRHCKGGYSISTPMPTDKTTGFLDMLGIIENEMFNLSGVCQLNSFASVHDLADKYINAITGLNFQKYDFHFLGRRSFTIRHLFNVREGIRREDCTVSDIIYKSDEGMTGKAADLIVDNERLADNLFNALGWDVNAIPSYESLKLLGGMDDILEEFPDIKPLKAIL